jgi:hypothetical protein
VLFICIRWRNQTFNFFFLLSPHPLPEPKIFLPKKMSSAVSESVPLESGMEAFDPGLFSAICTELEDAKEVQPPTLVVIPGQDGIVKRWAVTYHGAAVSNKC